MATIFPEPVRGYAICAEPRSGSNFLCQALASTGRLGKPLDYFNGPGLRAKGWADYPVEPELQLEAALAHGVTANGIYGLKMFSARFDEVARVRWAERLPALRFVHLRRRDLLGQAVSDARSVLTGQYRATGEAAPVPSYDRKAIAGSLGAIAIGEARWRAFFARNGIVPLDLFYEEVVEDAQGAAEAVAAHLGLDEPVRVDLGQVAVAIQRDDASRAWRERFLAESGDPTRLDRLDRPFGKALLARLFMGRRA